MNEYQKQQPEETSFLSGSSGDADAYKNYVSVLERLPEMKALYRERGWPQSVCEATFGDLELWAGEHKENTGIFGIPDHLLDWFNLHLHGKIVRLGRLQFNTNSVFGGYVKVFRNRTDGERCILCNGGLRIDAGGLRSHDDNGWITTFAESAEIIEGNPVEPNGHVKRETETIARVFGVKGITGTPNPNRMQKRLAEFISAGGVFHNGGIFILKDYKVGLAFKSA